jgi:hypothetical protein
MPLHDWTRVSPGTFHAFHLLWIAELQRELNGGLLPPAYYALAEHPIVGFAPDVVTLHQATSGGESPDAPQGAAVVVLDAPPQVELIDEASEATAEALRRRRLAIRTSAGDELVAVIELVSPGNKSSRGAVHQFISKLTELLWQRVHVVCIDLFPPTNACPLGLHHLIWADFDGTPGRDLSQSDAAIVSYVAAPDAKAYIQPVKRHAALPAAPLFLDDERYVNLPLEQTYNAAFAGMPARWRDVLQS